MLLKVQSASSNPSGGRSSSLSEDRCPLRASGAQNEKQCVAVVFELGAVVDIQGVRDGELGQVELARDGGELLLGGVIGADPGDARAVAAGGVELGQRVGRTHTLAFAVDGAIDDHRDQDTPRTRGDDLPQGGGRRPVGLAPATRSARQAWRFAGVGSDGRQRSGMRTSKASSA